MDTNAPPDNEAFPSGRGGYPHHWMLEVNLGNLEASLGEREEYWLLAIKAARAAATLTGQWDQSSQQTAG
jgi:hypothetical protein